MLAYLHNTRLDVVAQHFLFEIGKEELYAKSQPELGT